MKEAAYTVCFLEKGALHFADFMLTNKQSKHKFYTYIQSVLLTPYTISEFY